MTARSKGQLFLEKLQETKYKQLGRLAEAEVSSAFDDIEFTNELLEAFLQKQAGLMSSEEIAALRSQLLEGIGNLAKSEMPTRYEEPGKYSIMMHLAEEIEAAAGELGRSIPIHPQIGTLPTGQVNAMAIRVPESNEYLIVFESDLFTFALLLSKVIARAMPFKGSSEGNLEFSVSEEALARNLSENPEITRRFQEVILAYLIEGRPSAAPPYIPEEPYGALAAILRESMELFILAHEYGHIIKQHLSMHEEAPIRVGKEEASEIIRNWQQEFEADVQGLELMLHAMQKKGVDLALSFWGADFFFSCIEIVEHGISILRTGELEGGSMSTSHPPVRVRREMLREVLKKSLPEEQAKAPLELSMIVEQITASLFERVKPTLLQYYEAGKQPSAIWN